ncbi:hypothetical protein LMG33818_001658 [Halomonadaceae bacterium LMG 33818]|uniref:hypothetical protein n=1 Tax=Cernens ardua TaxID=3402176 RepID=UPI003EDC1E3C
MKLIKVIAVAFIFVLGTFGLQISAQASPSSSAQSNNTVVVQGANSSDQVSSLTGTNSQGIDTAHGHN